MHKIYAYLRQKWVDLDPIKTKLITGPFYTSLNTYQQQKCFIFL